MTLRIKLSQLLVGLVVGVALIGAGYALATTRSSVIHACVNSKTRALTVPAHVRCGRGAKALTWNQQGPRGATGPQGAAGASATGVTAYGQVWMGSGVNSAELAPGGNSRNVERVSGGAGSAVVSIRGCSATGLSAPVINISADADPANSLPGRNSAATAAAYITGWSGSDGVLEFNVSTYNATTGASANSDFSFTVYC